MAIAATLIASGSVVALAGAAGASSVSSVGVSVDSTIAANTAANWTITFTPTTALDSTIPDTITINFPSGVDATNAGVSTMDNCTTPPGTANTSTQVVITLNPAACPTGIPAGVPESIVLTGINPTAGTYPQSGFSVLTSQDSTATAASGADIVITNAVTYAADGSGTLTVTPTSVVRSELTTLTFTYTAASGGTSAGELDIAVPGSWTDPTTSNAAGCVTESGGGASVTIFNSTIKVTNLTLAGGATATVTYGATSGGSCGVNDQAVPPSVATTSVFSSNEMSTSAGTLTALASSPSVTVTVPTLPPPVPTKTTLTVSSLRIRIGTNVTFTAVVATASGPPAQIFGTVSFMNGNAALCTVPLDVALSASCTLTLSRPGTLDVVAVYNGSALFNASTSTTVAVTVLDTTIYASTGGTGDQCFENSPCSLATALAVANASQQPSATVYLNPGTYSGTLRIAHSMSISTVPGTTKRAVIDASQYSNKFAVTITSGVQAALSSLVIQHGQLGAILNAGVTNITRCNIWGSGYGPEFDGGFTNQYIIGNAGQLVIKSSTISMNKSNAGIIGNFESSTLALISSTVADNTSGWHTPEQLVWNSDGGASLYIAATAFINNPTPGAICNNSHPVIDLGFNYFGNDNCSFNLSMMSTDVTAKTAASAKPYKKIGMFYVPQRNSGVDKFIRAARRIKVLNQSYSLCPTTGENGVKSTSWCDIGSYQTRIIVKTRR